MTSEEVKQILITRLKKLVAIHNEKQKQWQKDHNLSEEVGCITREGCQITALLPEIQRFGIKLEDIKDD